MEEIYSGNRAPNGLPQMKRAAALVAFSHALGRNCCAVMRPPTNHNPARSKRPYHLLAIITATDNAVSTNQNVQGCESRTGVPRQTPSMVPSRLRCSVPSFVVISAPSFVHETRASASDVAAAFNGR